MHHYPLEQITDDKLRRLAQGVLNSYRLEGLAHLDVEKALANETTDLLALNEGRDPESLQEVRQRRQIADSVPDDDLKAQVVELDSGDLLLAHICRNDADETLLEIFTEAAPTLELLEQVVPCLRRLFAWCTPKYIALWPQPGSSNAEVLLALPGSLPGDSLIAAEKARLQLAVDSELTLRPFELERDWPWYEREYQAFLAGQPHMAHIVPISEREEVEEAIEAGLCSVALYRGEPLGMLMAESSSELGYRGVLISDIFIAGPFRGRGFASPMQRLFLNQQLDNYDFFLGFIHASNTPSWCNAAKQGRRLLRQEVYVPATLLS